MLVVSGVIQGYFSYQAKRNDLLDIQASRAAYAAIRISDLLGETKAFVRSTAAPPDVAVSLDERRGAFERILYRVVAIRSLSYVDANGRELLKVSNVSDAARGEVQFQGQFQGANVAPVGFPSFPASETGADRSAELRGGKQRQLATANLR